MKLLMHICCAPCTIYPLRILKSDGYEICGLFYNPNIHPYLEYKKRLDALKGFAAQEELSILSSDEYPMETFMRNVTFRESDRCRYCYYDRMVKAAELAKSGGFDGFTTTLLYSKFQNHELIKSIGESLANEFRIKFHYHDFREGWKEGIKISKDRGIYRQAYCGCIYSEKERFYAVQ